MPRDIYVFDAYGTLLDVHSAVARFRNEIGPHADRLSQIWRQKQLEYTWIRAAANRHATFRAMTEQGLDYAIASTGGLAPGVRAKLLDAYGTLAAYGEVPAMLARLRLAGARTAILSNGDPDMLATAIRSAGLDAHLDAVLSVADVGVYKPAMAVYAMATTRFACRPDMISFQSSNRWDIAGAKAFGFHTVWVNRSGAPPEYPDLPADVVVADLSTLGMS